MLTYSFENLEGESLYIHLYRCIRDDIVSGEIAPGTKLPSKRSFAENLGVSVITVENAYAQLISEGYLYAVPLRWSAAPRGRRQKPHRRRCRTRRSISPISRATAPTRTTSRLPRGRS